MTRLTGAGPAVAWFAAGNLAAFLLASALAALLQGQPFLLLAVLSVVAMVLALAGFAAGGFAARHFPARHPALGLGAGSAIAFIAVLWIASLAGADPRAGWALLLVLPLFGGLAPVLNRLLGPARAS